MCGIFGVLGFNNHKVPNEKEALNIVKSLSHRGPDSIGVYSKEEFCTSHTRLSIIDISSGNQPMLSNDQRWVISYNGEIYNYMFLKKELINQGYKFKTNSDTEVLLNGLIQFGINFLKKIEGMYAFALYDNKKKQLLLGRDHVGMKPLYYSITNPFFLL